MSRSRVPTSTTSAPYFSTMFGKPGKIGPMSMERPRRRRQTSIEKAFNSVSAALRLDDELEGSTSISEEQHDDDEECSTSHIVSSPTPTSPKIPPARKALPMSALNQAGQEKEPSFRHEPIHVPSPHKALETRSHHEPIHVPPHKMTRRRRRRKKVNSADFAQDMQDSSSDSVHDAILVSIMEKKCNNKSKGTASVTANFEDSLTKLHEAIMEDMRKKEEQVHSPVKELYPDLPKFDSSRFMVVDGLVVLKSSFTRRNSLSASSA